MHPRLAKVYSPPQHNMYTSTLDRPVCPSNCSSRCDALYLLQTCSVLPLHPFDALHLLPLLPLLPLHPFDALPAAREAVPDVHAVDDDRLEALAGRLVVRAAPRGGSGQASGGPRDLGVIAREAYPAAATAALFTPLELPQRLVARRCVLGLCCLRFRVFEAFFDETVMSLLLR